MFMARALVITAGHMVELAIVFEKMERSLIYGLQLNIGLQLASLFVFANQERLIRGSEAVSIDECIRECLDSEEGM